MLHASVVDSGIGIRPEQLKLLFEAFRQLDGSPRRLYEGTGLGLHLCRKLLDLMGGDIQVHSEFGAGSRFSFSVPLNLAAAATARAPDAATHDLTAMAAASCWSRTTRSIVTWFVSCSSRVAFE